MEYRVREWGVVSGPNPVEAFRANFRFRFRLHVFLALATLAFFLSLAFNVAFVSAERTEQFLFGSLFFLVLVVSTAGWFWYVALSGLSRSRSEMREMEDFLADALGTRYPPPSEPREDRREDE